MLKFNICGENVEVIDVICDYVVKWIFKLEWFFEFNVEVNVYVNLKVYFNCIYKVEVMILLFYLMLWVEEIFNDMYGSVDLVIDKLEC